MKLYRVYNGFMSNAPVNVIVIAENKKKASELASKKFKANDRYKIYGERYYKNLEVVLISDNLAEQFVSEVDEG